MKARIPRLVRYCLLGGFFFLTASGLWFLANGDMGIGREDTRILKYLCGGTWVPKCVKEKLKQQGEIEERLGLLGFSAVNVDLDIGHFALVILEAEKRYKVDHSLLVAVSIAESALETAAISEKGARGLFQLLPSTASGLWPEFTATLPADDELRSRDPVMQSADVRLSTLLGAYYFARLSDQWNGNLEFALASWNVGPNKLKEALEQGEVPGSRFVARVRRILADYRNPARLPNSVGE